MPKPNTNRFHVAFLAGQRIVVDPEKRRLYFWLREPFWTAGRQFGWPGNPAGLGVNKALLNYAKEHELQMAIVVGDKADRAYTASPKEWLDLHAIDVINGVPICIFPWSQCETVKDQNLVEVAKLLGVKAVAN